MRQASSHAPAAVGSDEALRERSVADRAVEGFERHFRFGFARGNYAESLAGFGETAGLRVGAVLSSLIVTVWGISWLRALSVA